MTFAAVVAVLDLVAEAIGWFVLGVLGIAIVVIAAAFALSAMVADD